MPELSVNTTGVSVGLEDAPVTASVRTVIQGSLDQFLAPIPASYLATPHERPQVNACPWSRPVHDAGISLPVSVTGSLLSAAVPCDPLVCSWAHRVG